jgi:hypothetical protein
MRHPLDGVGVGDAVFVGVTVAEREGVLVWVRVMVGVAVFVLVKLGVTVGVRVFVAVTDGVKVGVGVGVLVAGVGVTVFVTVCVGVLVEVLVGVGDSANATTGSILLDTIQDVCDGLLGLLLTTVYTTSGPNAAYGIFLFVVQSGINAPWSYITISCSTP